MPLLAQPLLGSVLQLLSSVPQPELEPGLLELFSKLQPAHWPVLLQHVSVLLLEPEPGLVGYHSKLEPGYFASEQL